MHESENLRRHRLSSPGRPLRAGFTLLELMVVMIIISVMASVAVPQMRMSESRRAQLAADDVAQKLEMARTKALSTRKRVRLIFDVDGDEVVGRIDHDEDGKFTGAAEEVREFREFGSGELPGDVVFGRGNAKPLVDDGSTEPVTIPDDHMDFNVRGVPTPFGTQGAIYLVHRSDPDAVAAIWVASSGAFRVWRWKDGRWQ